MHEEIITAARQGKGRKLLAAAGTVLMRLLLLGMIGWSMTAIYYSNLPTALQPVAAALFGLITVAMLLFIRPRRRGKVVFLVLFALLVVWWRTIPPSNNRDWQPDVATLSWADIAGDKITIHNIRNCVYRTETEFTVRHYDKSFDLAKLKSIDFFLVYWGSPKIAHTMMSFNFEEQGNVAFSIETRKEKGEEYSTIKGFFRQYEIIYVVADERDVVRLRTNYREAGKGEDVYLYRLNASPEVARKVFLHYLSEINRLKDKPEWYNALTSNCTTSIRQHTKPYNPEARLDWRMIVNGYIDEMIYERGAVDRSLPFAELKKRSYINPSAKKANDAADFSAQIRQGLPVSNAGQSPPKE
jgi:hypothetical protein